MSCVALLALGYLAAARRPDASTWFSLALVVASVVTLPHALLVATVMDAGALAGRARPGHRLAHVCPARGLG
ncbi:MAG: hypothetical protein WKG07_28060 [Hymenobacter sp.]